MRQIYKCYLCGKRITKNKTLLKQQNLSLACKEHFIPRTFFPIDYKIAKNVQLRTLPACHNCNNSFSNEEKNFYYFFGGLSSEVPGNDFILNDLDRKLLIKHNATKQEINNRLIDKKELKTILTCCKSDLYYPNDDIVLNLDGTYSNDKRVRDMKDNVIWKIVKGMYYIGTDGMCLPNLEYKKIDFDTIRMSKEDLDSANILFGKPVDGIEILYDDITEYAEIFMGRLIRHNKQHIAYIVLWKKWGFVRTFEL